MIISSPIMNRWRYVSLSLVRLTLTDKTNLVSALSVQICHIAIAPPLGTMSLNCAELCRVASCSCFCCNCSVCLRLMAVYVKFSPNTSAHTHMHTKTFGVPYQNTNESLLINHILLGFDTVWRMVGGKTVVKTWNRCNILLKRGIQVSTALISELWAICHVVDKLGLWCFIGNLLKQFLQTNKTNHPIHFDHHNHLGIIYIYHVLC